MIMFYPTGDKALYYIEQSSEKPADSTREIDRAHVFSLASDDPVMFLASCRCLTDSDQSELPSLSLITDPESLYPFLSIEMDFMKSGKLSTDRWSLLNHRSMFAGELANARGPIRLIMVSIFQNHLSLHYSSGDTLRLTIPPNRAAFYSLGLCFKIPEHRNVTAGGSYPRVTPEMTIRIEATNNGSVYSYKIFDHGDDVTKQKQIMTIGWRSSCESMQVDMRYDLDEVNDDMLAHTFPSGFHMENDKLFFDDNKRLLYHY